MANFKVSLRETDYCKKKHEFVTENFDFTDLLSLYRSSSSDLLSRVQSHPTIIQITAEFTLFGWGGVPL